MRAHRSSAVEPMVELGARDSASGLLARALFHGLTDASQEDGLLARYASPAILVDGRLQVIAANLAGADLAEALTAGRMPALARLVARCIAENAARHEEISQPGRDGGAVEAAILPTGDGETALVLCHDVTLDRNLRAALSESRERYKDLVEIVSDFAWETGPDGRFVFVSPRGALGYTAAELIGRPARDLMARASRCHGESDASPFASRETIMDAEIWVHRHDGVRARLSLSAVPLFAGGGRWCGARGVCRDVTGAPPRDKTDTPSRDTTDTPSRDASDADLPGAWS